MLDGEEQRARELRDAQSKAEQLFEEVERRNLIAPGATEKTVSDAVFALAEEMLGVSTYWHKRIVRAGANTLAPYARNPPDLTIGSDDIVFLDFGPVFQKWEADFGRTFVVGSDPLKMKLRHDVGQAFAAGKRYFNEHPAITGSELFHYACDLSARYGWEFGGPMAGHLIGNVPHERIAGDKISLYIHPNNDRPLRSFDAKGRRRHWILEMHFVDRKRRIGGFYEELLTL